MSQSWSLSSDIYRKWWWLQIWRYKWWDIFTTRKRSLGQGNVFKRVCHSVHSGWLPNLHHRSHDQGVCIQGGLPTRQEGGSASSGVGQTPLGLSTGGLHPEGLGRSPPRYMGYYGIWSTSGRYASYWNASLFCKFSHESIFEKSQNNSIDCLLIVWW